MMSATDEVIRANDEYAKSFAYADLPGPPARKLAVVTCMDARVMPDQVLGLQTGDAHVIRNAGGIITDDALRSLIISHYLLGTQEFMIINHTDCGMLKFKDEDFISSLEQKTGVSTVAPDRFYAFADLEENVRKQVRKVQSHPWLPEDLTVRGFVYDVHTGKLKEIKQV